MICPDCSAELIILDSYRDYAYCFNCQALFTREDLVAIMAKNLGPDPPNFPTELVDSKCSNIDFTPDNSEIHSNLDINLGSQVDLLFNDL